MLAQLETGREILQNDSEEVTDARISLKPLSGVLCLIEDSVEPSGHGDVLLSQDGSCSASVQQGDYRIITGTFVDWGDSEIGSSYTAVEHRKTRYYDADNNGVYNEGDTTYLCAKTTDPCAESIHVGWIRITSFGELEAGAKVEPGDSDINLGTTGFTDFSGFSDRLSFWDCTGSGVFDEEDALYLRTWDGGLHPRVGWIFLAWKHPDPSDSDPCPQQQETEEIIQIVDGTKDGFEPRDLIIEDGATVEWRNMDSQAHTTTSDQGVWDSGNLDPGQTFEVTFDEPGEYPYHCNYHGSQIGTIVVNPTRLPKVGNPVAVLEVTKTDGKKFIFDASKSFHPDGARLVSYKWSLPDGTTATGQTISWSSEDPGSHMVTLTVRDEHQQEGAAVEWIHVDDRSNPLETDQTVSDDAESQAIDENESQIAGGSWWDNLHIGSMTAGDALPWITGFAITVAAMSWTGIVLLKKRRSGYGRGGSPDNELESVTMVLDEKYRVPVQAKNIRIVRKGKPILNGVDLQIPSKTLTLLVGQSGSGKSMLLRSLLGLEDYAGKVQVLGNKGDVKQAGVQRQIGYVPQDLQLYPELSVVQNLSYFGENQGVRPSDIKTKTPELLSVLGLESKGGQPVNTLSGGEQRRASIACALIHKPDVLFMDEPSTGLDFTSRRTLCTAMQELVNRSGVTVLATTHYLDEARYADRVGIIDKGKLVAFGSPEDLSRSLPGRGRCVEIRFDKLTSTEQETLNGIMRNLKKSSRVEFYELYGFDLRVICQDPSDAVLKLPPLLSKRGLKPMSVQIDETRIEDVFIAYTGGRPQADRP